MEISIPSFPLLAVSCVLAAWMPNPASAAQPVSIDSLLREMTDRSSLAKWPDPEYTCHQASSYDRASVPGGRDQPGWWANHDVGQFIRAEPSARAPGKTEHVMMEEGGAPGAIVRIWSANPKGTLRIYLDGAAEPVIEAPMADVLGGKGEWEKLGPFVGVRARGYNLYLPIPYAKSCKVTSDEGGFYYLVNFRTYAPGTEVRPVAGVASVRGLPLVTLLAAAAPASGDGRHGSVSSASGAATGDWLELPPGPREVTSLRVDGAACISTDGAARRGLVLECEFDGERTVWCPVDDFFAAPFGEDGGADWMRRRFPDRRGGECRWVMPYERTARVRVLNLACERGAEAVIVRTEPWAWDDRSMHFHCVWRQNPSIQTKAATGTKDFTYADISGRGVLIGDNLHVFNPVGAWWGEGDEKIYVDGDLTRPDGAFPSHFGTGTEDYYGYAWCSNEPFTHPFHSQVRSDGYARGSNIGHTVLTRLRSLDAVPFRERLKFDMEVWHWEAAEMSYAATTYFYARPGAMVDVEPMPEEARRPLSEIPPPYRFDGAVECESMKIVAKADGLAAAPQGGFGPRTWSDERHLWVQGRRPGDFVELFIPAPAGVDGPRTLVLHATRSWDYGIVRLSVNGAQACDDIDLFNTEGRAVAPTGPLSLGRFAPIEGPEGRGWILRAEVVGGNVRSEGSRSYFGLDCVVIDP